MLKASSPGNGDNFGYAVGISGDTAIVGAYLEDTTQTDSGASLHLRHQLPAGHRSRDHLPSAGRRGFQLHPRHCD